jgi:hypothetical protein
VRVKLLFTNCYWCKAAPTTASVKSTTTTEQPADQYDDEYDETEEEAAKQDTSTTTTTEPPKKLGRGGVVRPFRSVLFWIKSTLSCRDNKLQNKIYVVIYIEWKFL